MRDDSELANFPGIPRPKTPRTDRIPLRETTGISAKDIEHEPMKYTALALIHLRDQIGRIAQMAVDHSQPVDEYQVQELQSQTINENILEVMPQYETPEIIEGIIFTGPGASPFNVQLGDRYWTLVMPNNQFLYMGPLVLCLSRNDRRVLTGGSAGQWSMELMGHADKRGNLI